MGNVLFFDVYKNTLKRADGFQPVSGERGYSQICCRFRKGDWAAEGNLLTGGFFVNSKQVTGTPGAVVTDEDEEWILSATFAIPSAILRKDSAFYFAVCGSYDNGDMVVVTNAVRIDVVRGMITDNITGNEEIISRYDELMAALNSALEAKQDKLERGTTNEFVDVDDYGVMKRSGYRVTTNENVIADRASADGFIPNARAVAKVINAVKALIPTKTSQLQNNSGFITQHQDISGKEDKSNKVHSITQDRTGRDATVDYPTVLAVRQYVEEQLDFYALEDEVPVNVSDLENDAGYITAQDIPNNKLVAGDGYGGIKAAPYFVTDYSDDIDVAIPAGLPTCKAVHDSVDAAKGAAISEAAKYVTETVQTGSGISGELVSADGVGTLKRSGYEVSNSESSIQDVTTKEHTIPTARAVARAIQTAIGSIETQLSQV